MILADIILELTSRTPSGGICRIGDVCFRVWYCADIWEWEFQGETYWDPLDLARAIVRAGTAKAGHSRTRPIQANMKRVFAKSKRPLGALLLKAGDRPQRRERP